MATVGDIIGVKGSSVVSVGRDATVLHAVQTMVEQKVGAVLVMVGHEILGIFTERDLMRRVVADGKDPTILKVSDVMTTGLATATDQTSIDEARAVMADRRLRHLPVLDVKGDLVGILAITDLNAYEVSRQKSGGGAG